MNCQVGFYGFLFFSFFFCMYVMNPHRADQSTTSPNPPHCRLRVSTPQRLAVKMPPQPDARHKSPLFMSVCAYLCLRCHQLWLHCNSYFPLFLSFFFFFFADICHTGSKACQAWESCLGELNAADKLAYFSRKLAHQQCLEIIRRKQDAL